MERSHAGLDRRPVIGAAGVLDALTDAGKPHRADHPARALDAVGWRV